MDAFTLAVLVFFPVALVVVGAVAGRVQEQRHLASLAQRESRYADIVVTEVRTLPPGMEAVSGQLVMGHVVVGSDRGKQLVAQLKNLLGGEIRSFQTVLGRARREAVLRMIDEARAADATAVVNVRIETSEITNLAAEVLCYGTAVRTAARPG